MTKKKLESMPEIVTYEIKDASGNVIQKRVYFTVKGLAARLPGRKQGGHMHISTLYPLIKEGMPGITIISGVRLLPEGKLPEVIDWLENRKSNTPQQPMW